MYEELNRIFDAEKWLSNNFGCEFYSTSKGWLNCSCPFDDHPDTNPSFGINMQDKCYKCFGCGKQGNFIQLVSALLKVPFIEAVNLISDHENIDFAQFNSLEYKNKKFQETLLEIDNKEFKNQKLILSSIIKIKKTLKDNFESGDEMYKELDNYIESDNIHKIKDIFKKWNN